MSEALGMSYAPKGKPAPACQEGEFVFAAVGLDHGHINGMCNGLTEAGAQLKWVYDGDAGKAAALAREFPGAQVATSAAEVLEDPRVQMVASATVPADHAELGMRVMRHEKDYFTDKPPLTTLAQLEAVRQVAHETGQKYAVYYSERLHVESAVFAGQLVQEGAIGRVLQVIGMGPHRASLASRPPWFFERPRYGGILCDIGSHQTEQFLFFTGNGDARVISSRVANYAHEDHPGMEDFGDCSLAGGNGATGYFRVDWFTPDGLSTWGDGRTFLLGTQGYIELDRTEKAMTQEHAFKAAELCIVAEQEAQRLG
jgi:predicted dehydrogenase